jgi:hypothetical protein
MAGVPSIMQAMLDYVAPSFRPAPDAVRRCVPTRARATSAPSSAIAKQHPDVMIGSYPFMDDRGPSTSIVVRAREADKLAAAPRRGDADEGAADDRR